MYWLHNEQKVQVCDARDDAQRTEHREQKITL